MVVREGHAADAAALREHLAVIMARHKIPRYLWLLNEPLPRNANGKFLKRQLRESLPITEAL